MGGCYTSYSPCSSSYNKPAKKSRAKPNPKWQQFMNKFVQSHELSDLISANKAFFRTRKKGFIGKLAEFSGIKKIDDIPKEFPNIEYEIKFNLDAYGKGSEPEIEDYLNAFDFPVGGNTRFLKDPINNIATGINHFLGKDLEEKLLVIEKAGKTFLKEKGKVVPLETGVPYEEIVIKRKESRYESPMSEIISKVQTLSSENVEYKGKIRKEKGDAFILDTSDGRIYSFTINRSHLTKAGEEKESEVQRQVELEYAGYIPKLKGFEKNSEKQIAQGMIDLAKYVYAMYNGAPISKGWRMNLEITGERKYDFVSGNRKILPENVLEPILSLEIEEKNLVPVANEE